MRAAAPAMAVRSGPVAAASVARKVVRLSKGAVMVVLVAVRVRPV